MLGLLLPSAPPAAHLSLSKVKSANFLPLLDFLQKLRFPPSVRIAAARMIALVVYTPGMVPLRGAEARAYARSGGMTATTAPTEAFRGGVVPTYRRAGSLRPSERVGGVVPTNRGRNAFPVAPAPPVP